MRIKFSIGLLMAFVLIDSCSAIRPAKTDAKDSEEYTEDLTAYRAQPLVIESAPVDTTALFIAADSTSLPVTERLNTVLDTAAAYSRASIKYIDGFTIQVYGGNDRSLANDYRLDIMRNFSDQTPKMVFEQPNYKIRIGEYYTRLEAQNFFAEVKAVFPRAILIPARIPIQ